MAHMGFRAFLSGPQAPLPPGPWSALLAVLMALVVVAVGQIIPVTLVYFYFVAISSGSETVTQADVQMVLSGGGSGLLLASQIAMALLTVFLAGRFKANSAETLLLTPPPDGLRAFAHAALVMVVALACINAIVFFLNPAAFLLDFEAFRELVRAPSPYLIFMAICVGAPLWEELLFRGFLLPPLANKLGFWPAAILVSIAWSSLHVSYSLYGLVEVFTIGLVFAFLLRQTRSVWVPMACHAGYNSFLFLLLRFYP
ncbi:MAG: lysostaphin resistance A-like protein [Hyphomicrobiaceae bacterium]